MSASTVSITANPAAAARRRPVVATDPKKKPPNGMELFPGDASAQPDSTTGDGKPDGANQSRDPSHLSIRGEAVLERTTKEVVNAKKTSSTISPRRTRKGAAPGKPQKPLWLTAVSVFAKNFVLLLVLAGLVQLVMKLARNKSGAREGETLHGFVDFEGRIAEVERLAKTTAKMVQVQVEVVDTKLGNEVSGLRREFEKKIGDKDIFLEGVLRKLVERSEALEKSVGELKAGEWLSKEEFERFYEDLKKGKDGGFGGVDVNLDDIRAYARDVVEKEIEKHAADGLGRVDYALASGGAVVVKHSEPYMAWKGGNWFIMATRGGVHPDAVKVLRPSFGEPGQCFPLKGSLGFIEIRLRMPIIPEAITLEHVAKSVAYDRSSAPKNCRVSGWLQGRDLDSALAAETVYLLAEFTYDLEKSNAQTFDVYDSSAVGLVDTVRLDFVSNHGSPSHTCVYRLRVHGHEPDLSSLTAIQP